MSEEVTADTSAPTGGNSVKPKRQLTEAQRLAFLKARETRARNVEIRREQKLANEAANPTPAKKPRVKKTAPVAAAVGTGVGDGLGDGDGVRVGVETAPVAPPTPTKEEMMEFLDDPAAKQKVLDHATLPDPHEYAKIVADIIYDKLNAEIVDMPPPPMPKVTRQRRRRTIAASQPEAEPEPELPPVKKEATGTYLEERNMNGSGLVSNTIATPRSSVGWM